MAEERIPRPNAAIDFLSRKENINTDRWDDLKWGEHSHAFTVAHSVDGDVVDTIHGLMNKAISTGEAFNTFKESMLEMMKEAKWYGGAEHTENDKKYINWRIRVIYDTNMKTAYAAGRYRKQIKNAGMRPIWEYVSKLVGKNRREEHIALHGKAFRYDDPFWNQNYPPNGWGCDCSVVTHSVSSATRDSIDVLSSDDNGNPPNLLKPDGTPVDWKNFAPPEWRYNPGREALAPNFSNFKFLSQEQHKDILKAVMKNYNQSMNGAILPKSEWDIISKRTNEPDYVAAGALFQLGNLSWDDYELVRRKTGIFDSKIMAYDSDLYHSMGHKQLRIKKAKEALKPQDEIQRLINQVVDVKDFDKVFQTYSNPEKIYKEIVELEKNKSAPKDERTTETYNLLHFTRSMGAGKVLRIVLRARDTKTPKFKTAIQWVSMEIVENLEYLKGRYEEIR